MADHPAKFTPVILDAIRIIVREEATKHIAINVLDPFAGTGRIHELHDPEARIHTYGVEIEPEWADMHPRTRVGDALALPFKSRTFSVVATSPTYGNRMADSHNAKDDSIRKTYKHTLGRDPHEHNSGTLHWGDKYKNFHRHAWREADRVLKPGGLFIVNVKDFKRTRTVRRTKVKEVVEVSQWHLDTIIDLGYDLERHIQVPVRGMGFGANGQSRVNHENIFVLRKETR